MKLNINKETVLFLQDHPIGNWSNITAPQEIPLLTTTTATATRFSKTTIQRHQKQLQILKDDNCNRMTKKQQCQRYKNPMEILRNPRYLFFILK